MFPTTVIVIIFYIQYGYSQISTACRLHTDCFGPQQICIGSQCVNGQSTNVPCNSDQDCISVGTVVGCKITCITAQQQLNQYCDSPNQQPFSSNGVPMQCVSGQCPNLPGYQCSFNRYCCSTAVTGGQFCDNPLQLPYQPNGQPVTCPTRQCINGYLCSGRGYCCSACDSPSQTPYMPNGFPAPCSSGCISGYQCSQSGYCCTTTGSGSQYCNIPTQQPLMSPNGFATQCTITSGGIPSTCTNGYICSNRGYCCSACDSTLQTPYMPNGFPALCSSGCVSGYLCSQSGYCCTTTGIGGSQYCNIPTQQPLMSPNGFVTQCTISSVGIPSTCTNGYVCSNRGYCCSACDNPLQTPYLLNGSPVLCSSGCTAGYQCSQSGYCCSTSVTNNLYCNVPGQNPNMVNGSPQQCTSSVQCNTSLGLQCSLYGYCCASSTTNPIFPGGYGGPCTTTQCFDSTMFCQNGICACRVGTYNGNTCTSLPKLNQPCSQAQGCDTTNSYCSPSGVCICITGYKPDINALACIKDVRPLQSPCITNAECNGAYNRCFNNKCVCQDGYVRGIDNNCRPLSHNCLYGEPLRNGVEVIDCVIYGNPNNIQYPQVRISQPYISSTNNESSVEVKESSVKDNESSDEPISIRKRQAPYYSKVDDCPENSYCLSYSGSVTLSGSVLARPTGFCCPMPRLRCPTGRPYQNANGCFNCPDNYFCFYARPNTAGVCCPKPCMNSNEVFVRGQCLGPAKLGDLCYTDSQCSSTMSRCLPNPSLSGGVNQLGRCTCPPGSTSSNGVCSQSMCRDSYSPSYPLTDFNGLPMTCTINNLNSCPSTHHCDPIILVCCPGPNSISSNNPCGFGQTFTGTYCSQSMVNFNCPNGVGRCTYSQTTMQYVCCQ